MDLLVREDIPWFLSHYLNEARERDDVRMSPGLAGDLAGLAPALVYSAGFDILCDEAEAYAQRLTAAQVPIVFRCFESLPHGFIAFPTAAPAAEAACRRIAKETAAALKRI